jgi:hypothetical protein
MNFSRSCFDFIESISSLSGPDTLNLLGVLAFDTELHTLLQQNLEVVFKNVLETACSFSTLSIKEI